MARRFVKRNEETGLIPLNGEDLFEGQLEETGMQILKILEGYSICTALYLLDTCKEAITQCRLTLD